ncbi:MAG: flagellin [Rhodothermales bacterium]
MGAFGDLARINTNVQSLDALNRLYRTNGSLGMRQLRLSTGSRINRAEDDSAGYSISKKLESRLRGQAQALANIGDAKSMLNVAEGSLNTIMDIVGTMKEKIIQGGNDTLGSEERVLIKSQLNALSTEINSIISSTLFISRSIFTSSALTFMVGPSSNNLFSVSVGALDASSLGVASTSLNVSSAASATSSLGGIDTTIQTIASLMAGLGNAQKALSFREENVSTQIISNESARSRIADADFAKEQMEIAKLQILQQTGINALVNSNLAPQAILALLQ